MLPTDRRLHTAREFAAVMRSGRRAGTSRLVVHLLTSNRPAPARAGFVVPGKVGGSVQRHRITRQLRPLVRAGLDGLPAGTDIVVRALAPAVGASTADLDGDLAVGLAAALRKARR